MCLGGKGTSSPISSFPYNTLLVPEESEVANPLLQILCFYSLFCLPFPFHMSKLCSWCNQLKRHLLFEAFPDPPNHMLSFVHFLMALGLLDSYGIYHIWVYIIIVHLLGLDIGSILKSDYLASFGTPHST